MADSDKKAMPTELGKHELGKMKVKSVEERNSKTNWVEFEGLDKKCVTWKDSKYPPATPLEAGNEDDLVIEIKEETDQRDGSTYNIAWVKSFGKKAGGGGGGGGGKGYVPKTPEEIHSASICGVVKSGLELCAQQGITDPEKIRSVAWAGVETYIDGIKNITGRGE